MNVSLTPQLEEFVSTKVESGRYNSASEVVREALRLLEQHDSARAVPLAEFNEELGRRLAALDRGESVDPASAAPDCGSNPNNAGSGDLELRPKHRC